MYKRILNNLKTRSSEEDMILHEIYIFLDLYEKKNIILIH